VLALTAILKITDFWSLNVVVVIMGGIISYFLLGLFSIQNIPAESNHLRSENEDLDESIIVEGTAFLVTNKKHTQGKLQLTKDRLIFYTHTQDITEFMLSKVSAIRLCSTRNFIKNGISILVEDKYESFELDYPKDWQKIIEFQINNQISQKV
jgi:serine/threonine protein kinase